MQPKYATIIFLIEKYRISNLAVRLKPDTPFISVQYTFINYLSNY